MKKYISIILSILCILSLVGCSKKEPVGDPPSVSFKANVLEINNQTYLVEPVVGSNELKSSDQIIVPMKNMSPSPEPKVGDVIEITYDGSIAESYPAQITEVYGIKVVEAVPEEVTVGSDLIPMVMVNGEIYMDTGHESTVEARCGMIDGEITSTVDGTKQPTKDNESNFGTGYGYQYGTEGTIEIYMNDKWWVFATEKALASSQLMVDPVAPVTIKNTFTGEEAPLSVNEDIRVISDILLSDTWNTEGTTDCLNNIEIIINGETYKYHSDCGTFNDKVKQQYLSLDDATKEKVNAIIEEHISLTATEVPAE